MVVFVDDWDRVAMNMVFQLFVKKVQEQLPLNRRTSSMIKSEDSASTTSISQAIGTQYAIDIHSVNGPSLWWVVWLNRIGDRKGLKRNDGLDCL